MDFEKLQNSCQNVPRDELEMMRKFGCSEKRMKALNGLREKLKLRGRPHVLSVPIIQFLSVRVVLDRADENKPISIYGRIYGEYDHIFNGNKSCTHNVYNRGHDEPETIRQTGNLTLIEPDGSYLKFDVCMSLHKTTIVVDLWDADQKTVFSQGSFLVEEIDENEYEQVKEKVVPGMSGYVVVRYIAMPFATLYQVKTRFFHKGYKKEGNNRVVNVNGKIVIRYGDTYGNYSSEEYTIFEKPNFEFEPVAVDSMNRLGQSRYWICVPAYSCVVVDWDLWDFDTKRNIVKETLKFPTQQWFGYHHTFTVDDLAIDVQVSNHGVYSREVCKPAVMCSDGKSSSNVRIPWTRRPEGQHLLPGGFVELYSVFIGREKNLPLRIFGVIEGSFGGHTFDIFRREENNALELSEDETSIPILDGHREYDHYYSLKIMFDLKDVDGRVLIKGFVKWRKDQLGDDRGFPWWDLQLCSVIAGEHGFAALHYTIFSLALLANMEVFYKIKDSCCDVVYGSLVAQYDNYDYSSRYKRECYRTVLFKRKREEALQVASDMKLPLCRSLVVVLEEATLMIEVDLWSVGLGKCLSHMLQIEVGCPSITIHKDGFWLDINLEWRDG